MLIEQNFVIVHTHVSQLQLEAVSSLHPANVDCPDCKGSGQVDQQGGRAAGDVPGAGGLMGRSLVGRAHAKMAP